MMLLERWLVAAALGLTMPLIPAGAGAATPQQAGQAQTTQPAKAAGSQDPQTANDDDEDVKPGTSAYDRDTQNDDQTPGKADQQPMPANAEEVHDLTPGTAADDLDKQTDDQRLAAHPQQAVPMRPDHDQDAMSAKGAQDQPATPAQSANGRDEQTQAKATQRAFALAPATPEQARQQQLQKDSATLLQMVQDLKLEVEKAGSNTLSLAAVRKADEIQKLAKNLKERMKEQGQTLQSKP